MKKLWAGIGILAVLLAMGIGAAAAMGHFHRDLGAQLEQAAELCQTDWKTANTLAGSARQSWQQHRHWVAALADHEPLEEISSLFSQLSLCQKNADAEEFAVVCLRISGLCDMLSESHNPYWWNLL